MSISAWAGNGFVVGSGGDAITCLGSVSNCPGNMSHNCRKLSFGGSVTQEFFVASMLADQNQAVYLESWAKLTEPQTRERLFSKISSSEIYPKIIEVSNQLGRVDMGLGMPHVTTLSDVQDSILTIQLPKNCSQQQAVIRADNYFYFDSTLVDLLKINSLARQVELINFHEYLYYYGKTFRGHQNSLNTQNLIIFLLSQEASANEITEQLRKLNFID